MKLKHIALAALALVAGVANAANIARSTGTSASNAGLVLAVTNINNGTSYDLDLGTNFNTFYSNLSNASFAQSFAVNDANWTTFTSGTTASDLVWTVFSGNNKGAISTVGNKALLTTINNNLTTASITSGVSSGLGQSVGNIDLAVAEINTSSSASFIGKTDSNAAFFGDKFSQAGKSGYDYNGNISTSFVGYNLVNESSNFQYITTTGKGKAIDALSTSTFAGQFTFKLGNNGAASLVYAAAAPVTPSVPEPSSAALALVGLLLAGVVARRRA